MKHLSCVLTIALTLSIICIGCSNNREPTIPIITHPSISHEAQSSHHLWGYYQFICDPDAGTINAVPLREIEMHLNVLSALEPPPYVYLTLESPPHFSGGNLEIDIGIRHPYLGMTYYTGFDVCGILITNGSVSGVSDPELVYAAEDETRLINADGLTRWWNPTDFPYNPVEPMKGYIDGMLGTPDAVADYSCTLNGYKFFADSLEPDDELNVLDPTGRGVFTAGTKNVRHYFIHLGNGPIFNYAIDACWAIPDTNVPPIEVPEDFPPNANRSEAWRIDAGDYDNTLFYEESTGTGGGHLYIEIDVYDHFNAGENIVYIESLTGLGPAYSLDPTGGGIGYSTYELDISGEYLTQNGWVEVLIGIQSEVEGYGGKLPGVPVTAYFLQHFYVQESYPHDYILIFPNPPVQLSDSSWYDSDNEWPRVIEDGCGQIIVAWQQNPPDNSGVRPVNRRSLDNGETWEPMDSSISSGGELKQTKMALDANGTAYQACLHYDKDGIPATTSYLVRCPPMGEGYWGWSMGIADRSLEVIFTQDGYPLYFLDFGGEIKLKRGEVPNSCFGKPPADTSWHSLVFHDVAVSPALLSYSPSVVRDLLGVIHLAYLDNSGVTKVCVVSNYDGTGLDWSEPHEMASGGGGVITVYDPAMAYDDDGGLHFIYINEFAEVIPMRRIIYNYSSKGSPYLLSEFETAMGTFYAMEYPSVDAASLPLGLAPAVVAATGNTVGKPEDINCAWRNPLSGEWSDEIGLNVGGPAIAPAMWVDSQHYVHVVWQQQDDIWQWQIMYRRGEFIPTG